MAMKGALVFLAVFAIVVIVTIAGVANPPGAAIYSAVLSGTAVYTSQYAIVGTNTYTLIVAVFNGVIYGYIVWLAFTIINALTKKDKKDNVNVNVVVNNNAANPPPPPPQ
jgi:CBS-domain-containing membrane protein